jgi:membrane protein DedA with SNARE-associated domain
MPIYGRFMIFTIVATIAFNGAFVGIGWALGNHWDIVVQYASIINYVTIAIIAGGDPLVCGEQMEGKQTGTGF